MKRFLAILFAVAASADAYPFQNLDFEMANPVSTGDPNEPFVIAASAFPGWTAYCGTVQQTEVFQNDTSTGQAIADIFGPTSPPPIAGVPGIIDGKFSAGIQGGADPHTGGSVSTSLEQTGLFPAGDQSLEFKAWGQLPGLSVAINGNTLPLFALATTANYTLFGVDTSSYAGQTGTLSFVDTPPSGAVGLVELDDITFSTSSVPEPNPAILLTLGSLVFAIRRRITPLLKIEHRNLAHRHFHMPEIV